MLTRFRVGYAERIQEDNFDFEYGIVRVTDYTDIRNPIETEYFSCIRLGIVEKTKNFAGDHFTEVQFIYKDNSGKANCAKFDRMQRKIEVLKQGNMQIEL